MKEKLDKYIADNLEKETKKVYEKISLKELLETSFYANKNGELVGEFTLTRINQIADLLTYLNEDVRTGKEIIGELEKEITRLNNIIEKLKNKIDTELEINEKYEVGDTESLYSKKWLRETLEEFKGGING